MPENRSLDPRFDPRYQRGFDPSTMPVEPERLRAPVEDAGPVPPASPVPPAEPQHPSSRHVDEGEVDERDAPDEEFAPPPGRNPFRLALLLVSAGLLALAGGTLWWMAQNRAQFVYGPTADTPVGWMLQQLMQILPPAAIVGGFVGLALWLGLGALDAQRRSTGRRVAEPIEGDDE